MKLGLDALANAVKVTLGPAGRNVAYEKSWGAPGVTKDGVTVAKGIELAGKFQNMGCEMVRQVASRTNDEGGRWNHDRDRAGPSHLRRRVKLDRGRLQPHGPQARHRLAGAAVVEH